MSNQIITQQSDTNKLAIAGQVANRYAARSLFDDYRHRKAANTIRRQDADLMLFADFLAFTGVEPGDLHHNPNAWRGISWGLVAGFVRFMLGEGYAVTSVNIRLSTVKTYAELAFKAGALDHTEYALIQTVEGYSHKEIKRVDARRKAEMIPTRKGYKKAESVCISQEQAKALKNRPNTPQGRRDALLICLLLDHGLRVGEVAILDVSNFDLAAGMLTFYRPKVDMTQTHQLTSDTWKAAKAYFKRDAPKIGRLLRKSLKGGRLGKVGMSERALTQRVHDLGAAIGVTGLSAHDLRHSWATTASQNGTPIERLKDAGGWSSLAMPERYIQAAQIANEGVRL